MDIATRRLLRSGWRWNRSQSVVGEIPAAAGIGRAPLGFAKRRCFAHRVAHAVPSPAVGHRGEVLGNQTLEISFERRQRLRQISSHRWSW